MPCDDSEFIPSDEVCFSRGEVIGITGGRKITGDLFVSGKMTGSKRPAIVFLHGGGWFCGSPGQFYRQADHLASACGFLSLCLDYRLSGEAGFPAALHDVKCAVRWIRANAARYEVDTEKIAVAGSSAGAHLAAMLITTDGIGAYEGDGGDRGFDSRADAAVLIDGVYDMKGFLEKKDMPDDERELLRRSAVMFLGGLPREVPQIYDEASPVKRINGVLPPVLLMHGSKDRLVSCRQAVCFYERLVSNRTHAEIEIFEGRDHGWHNSGPDSTAALERIKEFLSRVFVL